MAAGVPPPPINSPNGSYYWLEWYTSLTNFLNGTNIPWSNLNFTGSNLTDILTRNHNDLQNIQGGFGTTNANGQHWHMTGKGYCTSGGTMTGAPTGWTMVRNSAGVFTLTTTGISNVAPNIAATATSNTSAVTIQWIDLSTAGSVVFHLVNTSNVATDGNFSFTVMI